MASKLDLNWGSGFFSAFLDIRSKELFSYASVEDAQRIHETYGGQCYYTSRSGLSGAGWLPGNPALRSVSTYRVDSYYPDTITIDQRQDTLPGIKIIVPMNYQGHKIPADWPIAVIRRLEEEQSDQLYLVDSYSLFSVLLGYEGFEWWQHTIRYVPSPSGEMLERRIDAKVPARTNRLNYRAAIMRLYHSDFSFKMEGNEWEESEQTPDFWKSLGLRQIGGNLYKIGRQVCYGRYTREELASVEALQAVAPASAAVIAPNVYLQETNQFYANGLIEVEGKELSVCEPVEVAQAIVAMSGDIHSVLYLLNDAARAKLEEERRQAEAEEQRRQAFLAECAPYGDEVVTLEDASRYAGYRDEEWTRSTIFEGADTLTVRELAERYTPHTRYIVDCVLRERRREQAVKETVEV